MRAVTDQFLASLRSSHLISSSCTLLFGDGSTFAVPVEAGSVTMDRTAQSRRTGHVQIPWSLAMGAQLGLDVRSLPLGGYVRLGRGLRYPDGTREEALLGVLRVESVAWRTLEASATLELSDRMAQVRDESFTTPFVAGGMRIAAAAVAVVQGVFGDTIDYLVLTDPAVVVTDVFYSGGRGDALTKLAAAASAETYFDGEGSFVFGPAAGLGEQVWTVDAGTSGVMVNASEALDRTGIYNGVIVEGQADATGPPVTGLATFDDPASPIRWGGPFGKVALYVTNTAALDSVQCAAIAESMLSLKLLQTRQLTLTAAPNPALEAGDTIQVVFPDGRDELHLIDALTTDLATGEQSIQTRTLAQPADAAPLTLMAGAEAWQEARGAVVIPA